MTVTFTPLGLSPEGAAQTVSESDFIFYPEEHQLPPIELIESPVIPAGKILVSPSLVREVLENFLKALPIFSETSGRSYREEGRVLSQTLIHFLESEQFYKVVLSSQRNREPIELALLEPKGIRESHMIHDFSRAFRFPLQFEPTRPILTSSVSISLIQPFSGIIIRVKLPQTESVYVVSLNSDSSFKRYETPT